MLAGHVAVALVAARVRPQVPLAAAVAAALLPDLLGSVFQTAGLEQVRFHAGLGAANYFDAVNIAFSHSLLFAAGSGAVFAAAWYRLRRDAPGAALLFAAVASHWILDWVSHRPDLPLAPGTLGRYGLGLWTSIPATLALEGGLWLLALVLYSRALRPRALIFWPGVALLTLAWLNNIAGPPPSSPRAAPVSSLVFFSLVVAWAHWTRRRGPHPCEIIALEETP